MPSCTKGILKFTKNKRLAEQSVYEPKVDVDKGKDDDNSKGASGCINAGFKPSRIAPCTANMTYKGVDIGCINAKQQFEGRAVHKGLIASTPWKENVEKQVTNAVDKSSYGHIQEESFVSHASSVLSLSISSLSGHPDGSPSTIRGLAIRGKIKLEVSFNALGLTVHVAEAKDLHSPTYSSRNPVYAEVAVMPEDSNTPATFVTPVVKNDCPVFDETFSLQLSSNVHKMKRIVISLRQMTKSNTDIVGCTSFGVKHIQTGKHVAGWFYLLNDKVGRKKHLRVLTSGSHLFPGQSVCDLSVLASASENGVGKMDNVVYDADVESIRDGDRLLPSLMMNNSSFLSAVAVDFMHHGLRSIDEENADAEDKYNQHQVTTSLQFSRIPACGSAYKTSHKRKVNSKKNSTYSRSEYLPSSVYDQNEQSPWMTEVCDNSEHYKTSETGASIASRQSGWDSASSVDRRSVTGFIASEYSSLTDNSSICQQDLVSHTSRWQHIEYLFRLEEDYIHKVHYGKVNYSQPLNNCILSSKQHKVLFQNMEKLLVISQFHMKRLHDMHRMQHGKPSSQMSGVGAIYKSQLVLMCDAYAAYIQGLPQALSLLRDLMTNCDFTRFLRKTGIKQGQFNILDFIKAPKLHLEELLCYLNAVMLNLTTRMQDFSDIKELLEAMSDCLRGVSLSSSRRCSKDSGVSCTSLGSTSQSSLLSTDAEVAALQDKLVFPRDVGPFQIVGPNRHILFSGDMYMVDGWKWVKVHLILLSDMLLITQSEIPSQVISIQEPILLKDILELDFSTFHPAEFSVTVRRDKILVFRTLQAEERCTWHHLLEQRINTCHTLGKYTC